jgi:hypothetical protein
MPMPLPARVRRFLHTSLAAAVLTVGGVLLDASQPRPSYGAEEIRITAAGPLMVTVSVDSLATFAETGELPSDLALYARFLDEGLLAQLRTGLSFRLPVNVVNVDNVAYSPLGRDALYNLGKVVQATPGENGATALRAAVINAAAKADGEGWTIVDALREFPTQSIDIDLQDLLALRRELSLYFSYNQAANRAIQAQAEAEAIAEMDLDMAALPDLSQPAPTPSARPALP